MAEGFFRLHEEHLTWQTEHERWNRDLRDWEDEAVKLAGHLADLWSAALKRHREEIFAHGASIDAHETTLAAEERDGEPDDTLLCAHGREEQHHGAARARHRELAARMQELRALVAALEATTG